MIAMIDLTIPHDKIDKILVTFDNGNYLAYSALR